MARYTPPPFSQPNAFVMLLGLVAGIAAGTYLADEFVGLAVFGAGMLLMVYSLYRMRRPQSLRRRPPVLLWAFMAFAGVGIVGGHRQLPGSFDFGAYADGSHWVRGIVESKQVKTYGDRLTVSLTSVDDSTGVRIASLANIKARLTIDPSGLAEGDEIIFINRLKPIEEGSSISAREQAERLYFKKIRYTQRASEGEFERGAGGNRLRRATAGISCRIAEALEQTELDTAARGFIMSILTGDKSEIDYDTRCTFARAGIAHIMAVSGMHVGIVASAVWLLLLPLYFILSRRVRIVITVAAVWAYALLCGMSAPVVRASVMASVLFASQLMERVNNSFNALCLSALVILMADPMALYDAGFQFSFCTVAALVLFTPPVMRRLENRPAAMRYVAGLCLTSCVAMAGSWHLTAYYFHSLPLFFLPMNLVAVPLLPLFILAGFGVVSLHWIGLDPSWLTAAVNYGFDFLRRLASLSGGATADDLWLPAASLWLYTAFLIAAGVLVYTERKKTVASLCALLVLSVVTVITTVPVEIPPDRIRISNSFGNMAIQQMRAGNTEIHFTRRSSVRIEPMATGGLLAVVDCRRDILSRFEGRGLRCRYALVGRQYDGTVMDLCRAVGRPEIMIVSSQLSSRRSKALMCQCDSLGIRCHSLGKGPFILERRRTPH